MKQNILALSLLVLLAACGNNESSTEEHTDKLSTDLVSNPASGEGADPAAVANMPTMDFADTVHNFGNIKEGEVATYDFEFVNNGKTPLIVSSAKGSCGCTVPDYPHEPVQPGEKGVMTVKFNSEGKPGHQEKSVIIHTNSNRGTHDLYIKADVEPKEQK